MRSKRIVTGLNNNQKIRFVVNGFAMFCQVKDIQNISTTAHRAAVWSALEHLGTTNWLADRTFRDKITGYGTTVNGIDVQVDLCDENTLIV